MTTSGVHQLFVSYSRKDAAFVQGLRRRLKRLPVSAWQDVQDLMPGQSWQHEIDRALKQTSTVLLVLSRHSVSSPYVNYEWAYAMGAGATVIPILKDKIPLHPRLAALEYVVCLANIASGQKSLTLRW